MLGLPYLHVGKELRLCLLVFKQVEFIVFGFGIEARAWRQGTADMLMELGWGWSVAMDLSAQVQLCMAAICVSF